ncbi:uncharacterized protein LOC110463027 [Mizuhopecten yessoensis]|uniref:uncharacterized protein LOC110463027 n=1 Tax=Mizuhopecten yessoensis TaxID=6573 RepID=UPI000B45A7B7|nr:uncharacterized protein LOC110463027 [Mizuhopecten yessoensis]
MYDPGNLTSETENGDQRSSNIGGQNDRVHIEEETETDQDPSAMSKLAITGGDKETHLSTGWKSTCNYDHQDGVKEERTTVVPKGSYSPGSSDEAQLTVEHAQSTPYSITTATKISLGRSLRTYEDGNKKERRMPQRSDSSGSSDGDSETASSDEETDGVPFNYCNIAVPLKIFELYFAIPGSAFNQCIDKLQLKVF